MNNCRSIASTKPQDLEAYVYIVSEQTVKASSTGPQPPYPVSLSIGTDWRIGTSIMESGETRNENSSDHADQSSQLRISEHSGSSGRLAVPDSDRPSINSFSNSACNSFQRFPPGEDDIHGSGEIEIQIEESDMWQDSSINITTSTLQICQAQILRPYTFLLTLIAWRRFKKESYSGQMLRWRIFNVVYTFLVLLLLGHSYIYEWLSCQWELDISKESRSIKQYTMGPAIPYKMTTLSNITDNVTQNFGDFAHFVSPTTNSPTGSDHDHKRDDDDTCNHTISTYLLPSILHLAAYLMGLYHFRFRDNEQLYSVMQKVFLQASSFQLRTSSQLKMIKWIRTTIALGSLWVAYMLMVHFLYYWSLEIPFVHQHTAFGGGEATHCAMLAIGLVGHLLYNCVILAIVTNYLTHCEMIKFYVCGLVTRLQEKSTDLKTAMNDMLTIRQNMGVLNGVISKMTSLVTFITTEMGIIGLCILIFFDKSDTRLLVYRAVFPFGWLIMMVLPLCQAARVNSMILRIHKTSLEMRVFGYRGASILDLDSFIQFVAHVKPNAKLFSIPMKTSHIIFIVVISSLVLIIIIQSEMIHLATSAI